MEVLVDRCAGLDVHKKTVVVCVRTPGTGRQKRSSEVRTFGTFEHQLIELREWLIECGVTSVAMEATGVFWKPVWHVLDDGQPFELLLVNPGHIKNVPGRKTDVNDATWIGQLLECGLLRGSFVPPVEIRELREVTRYRRQLTEERAREIQRLQKVLEDANVKLSSVVSEVLGVSGRMILKRCAPANATLMCSPTWPNEDCVPRSATFVNACRGGSTTITPRWSPRSSRTSTTSLARSLGWTCGSRR